MAIIVQLTIWNRLDAVLGIRTWDRLNDNSFNRAELFLLNIDFGVFGWNC